MRKLLSIGILVALTACQGNEVENDHDVIDHTPAARIKSPNNDAQYTEGDIIEITIEVNKPDEISDLTLMMFDEVYMDNIAPKSQTIKIDSKGSKLGIIPIKLTYTDKEGIEHGDSRNLVLFSSTIPEQKVAQIEKAYVHDKSHFIQGLEFYDGELYESTGQNGRSGVFQINLDNGVVKKEVKLDNIYFGEGITILNDTIYELTWQDNLCVLYDMDFNKIGEFTYSGEGWGLTNDGTHLIMTNGTDHIVWRDPRTFEVVKKIYAFANDESVYYLNECEMIGASLYANIWQENRIVEIDTATGAVISFIDCTSLVAEQPMGADVLNGIAHNPATGKIYLTGKYWDKLYEVTIK